MNQQPTANSQQPTANSQQPTANSQQPTANSQQPTANSHKFRHNVSFHNNSGPVNLKVNFTKKEYGLLLQMVDTATWVMNAHRTEKDSRVEPFLEMEQKIFAQAKEFGCEDKIDPPNATLKAYTVTEDFAFNSPHRELIEEYDEDTFYTTLVDRLTYVSIIREVGLDKYQAMDYEEKSPLFDKYESYWHEQLGEQGVDALLTTLVDVLLSKRPNLA